MQRYDSLRALLAVQYAGSLVEAAKQQQKSASQLRQAISDLEDELGMSLLARDGYRARLSEQGRFIAAQSGQLLNELDSLNWQIASVAKRQQSQAQLRLGFLDALPLAPYGNTLWQLQQQQAQLNLRIEHLHITDIVQQLEFDELDFGVVFFHRLSLPNLTGKIIGQAEIVTVVSPAHPLARPDKSNDLDARMQHLQLSPSNYLGFGLDELSQSSENHWQIDNIEMVVSLLEQGLGWAALPRHWVEPQLQEGKLVQLSAGGSESYWGHLQLLWHKDRLLSRVDHWLIEQLSSPRPGLAASCLPI